jgi:hypothetical protein
MKWELSGVSGKHERTAHFEHRARSGRFYTKTVSEYHGASITRYPSEEYFERHMAGLNEGKRAKTWERL